MTLLVVLLAHFLPIPLHKSEIVAFAAKIHLLPFSEKGCGLESPPLPYLEYFLSHGNEVHFDSSNP